MYSHAQAQHLNRQGRFELLLEVAELQYYNHPGRAEERSPEGSGDQVLEPMGSDALDQLSRDLTYHGRFQLQLEKPVAGGSEKSERLRSKSDEIEGLEREKEYYRRMIEFHKSMAQKYFNATKYPWLFFNPGPLPPDR
jgi:hypothetical protein